MSSTSLADARSKFERLKSLFEADPANAELRRDCIALARQLSDFDFVLHAAGNVLAQSPDDSAARFDRATALIGKKDYAGAIEVLKQLRAEFPDQTAVARDLGLCHYCLGEYARVRPELKAAYSAGDRSADLIRLLVSTLHHLAAVDEAIEIADRNSELAEHDGALAGVFALLYLDAELRMPALKWAKVALERNPDSADGLVVQGTLAAEQMNTALAIHSFERALRSAPEAGRAWLGLGTMALLANDVDRAKAHFTQSLEHMPGHVGSWHVLAWTHILANDIDAAEKAFRQAAELDRNFAETQGGLAAVAALRGDSAAAKRLIELARKLDPRCLSAQFAESVLMGRSGEGERAKQTLMNAALGLAETQNTALSQLLRRAVEGRK